LQKVSGLSLAKLYRELAEHGGRGGRGLAPKTRRNVHTMLHRAFADAVRQRLLTLNPADAVDPPRIGRPEIRPWTAVETGQFLRQADGDRLAAAYVLAATTGMRRGEVLGLRWGDLDLEGRWAQVQRALVLVGNTPTLSEPKSKAGRRSVPLALETVAALKAHRRAQAAERLAMGPDYQDGGLVFCQEDGTFLHPERFLDAFRAISGRAGLRPIRLHDLRHGFATRALEAGVPAKVVQEVLGHASVAVTLDLYSHVIPAMQRDATSLVAGLIYGSVAEPSR
jgi:integrase